MASMTKKQKQGLGIAGAILAVLAIALGTVFGSH